MHSYPCTHNLFQLCTQAFIYHNFLSRAEATHVLQLASIQVCTRNFACLHYHVADRGCNNVKHPHFFTISSAWFRRSISFPPPSTILFCNLAFAPMPLDWQMKRSTVVGPNNTGVVDNIRTSAGTFIM